MSPATQPGGFGRTLKPLPSYERKILRRVSRGGKKMWKNLGTKLKSVAEKKLDAHISAVHGQQPAEIEVSDGKLTFGKIVELYRVNFRRNAEWWRVRSIFCEAGVKKSVYRLGDIAKFGSGFECAKPWVCYVVNKIGYLRGIEAVVPLRIY